MSFSKGYIERYVRYPAFIEQAPVPDLGIIVVIPSYIEPELLRTINSLSLCLVPQSGVEVIVVVNEPEFCTENVHRQNDITISELSDWKKLNPGSFFNLYTIRPAPFPKKHAGAGMARKTGMDEAIRRFEEVGNPRGIILSLDADTLVDTNYFVQTEQLFHSGLNPVGATLAFCHRVDELEDERLRTGILLYEKYLHYYKEALAFSGYPNAIHTIGSAFAVRADAYVKQGGMNRRQAGEDFYFLHKLTQLGLIAELNSTRVYPSARVSDRVPFGTGFAMKKWFEGDDSLMRAYCFRSFCDLKYFLRMIPLFYSGGQVVCPFEGKGIAEPLTAFLEEDHFGEKLLEIKRNSSSLVSFHKRFFLSFNAFKIMKFLNFSHARFYKFQDMDEAYLQLQMKKRSGDPEGKAEEKI